MASKHAELLDCPTCKGRYKLVRAEAGPETLNGTIECYYCGGPADRARRPIRAQILRRGSAAKTSQAIAREVGRLRRRREFKTGRPEGDCAICAGRPSRPWRRLLAERGEQ
jgi:hypothetical protein